MLFEAPLVAGRDCRHCRTWQYDEKTGEPDMLAGELRPRFIGLLCEKGRCPKRGPNGERQDLTLRNLQAWIHYQECRAVGQFPDDPIVRRNARIMRGAEEAAIAKMRAG